MEDSLQNTQHSKSSVIRVRKSIFASQKPKPDNQQPKLMLNGETLEDWRPVKSSTTPNFFTPSKQQERESQTEGFVESRFQTRTVSRPVYLPENAFNRVIITDPNYNKCIRPSSVGKRSVVFNNSHQIIQKPAPVFNSQILTPQKPVLASSIIIPPQSTNIVTSQSSSNLKKKVVFVEGKPHESVIFRQVPIQQPQPIQIIKEIHPQINKIIIQDDPKTISQLNKLNSLNQFLTHQYTLINNQLIQIRNRTTSKDIVQQRTFLQKSMNTIDDIFMRQTSEALYKLDQISRCSSTKQFTRVSISKGKRTMSPKFNRKPNNLVGDGIYSPVNGVQQMQNSSYIECLRHEQFNG